MLKFFSYKNEKDLDIITVHQGNALWSKISKYIYHH